MNPDFTAKHSCGVPDSETPRFCKGCTHDDQVVDDVKVLSASFGPNVADIRFDGAREHSVFPRGLNSEKQSANLALDLAQLAGSGLYLSASGKLLPNGKAATDRHDRGDREAADRCGYDRLLCRPTESPMHEPSFTIIAVPGRIRFTA
jgi:hypothetical protein